MIERRQHPDTAPRATYAQANVIGNCQLVRVGSLAHEYMVFMGFDELDRDGDCALMRCPQGWVPE